MTTKTLDDFRLDDVFDSRDVIERIDEIKSLLPNSAHEVMPGTSDEIKDLRAELATLEAFAAEAEGYASDWQYGATFIRDWYFKDYAQDLAEEIGAIKFDYSWPVSHIDWDAAADALKMDYSAVDLDGVTFWTR